MADAWSTGTNTVSRDEAKTKIVHLARQQGIQGAFKVFHQGNLISNPDALPAQVNMEEVSVSAVLDQARS